jgi:hypothetical protein
VLDKSRAIGYNVYIKRAKEGITMKTYFDRTPAEQEIICKAYEFEIKAIEEGSAERNPYFEDIKAMGLWEALSEAVEMACH